MASEADATAFALEWIAAWNDLEFTHEANLDLEVHVSCGCRACSFAITAEIGTANERAWPTAGYHACAIVPVVADCCGRKLFLMIANEVIDTTPGPVDGLRVYVGPLQDPWSTSVVPIPGTKLARLPKKL
jgi:hypothetical protein